MAGPSAAADTRHRDTIGCPRFPPPPAPMSSLYAKGERCGVGTFGTVKKATCLADGSTVAIKKIHNACSDQQGISVAAMREVKTLRDLRHENVVSLLNVFTHKNSVKLVFEYLEQDLKKYLDKRQAPLPPN